MSDIFKELIVVKRSGQRVTFNGTKIAIAIDKAFDSVFRDYNIKDVNRVYEDVLTTIKNDYKGRKTINVEDIQNIIEESLKKLKYNEIYTSFSEYRVRRAKSRDVFEIKSQHKFLKAIEKVDSIARLNKEEKPDEMLDKFAKVISKEYATSYLIEGKVQKALEEGVIYLNDLRYYSIGNTSSAHLNLDFNNIFTIEEYINEVIKTLILVKKDQYKSHTIMNFDSILRSKVLYDFKKILNEEFNRNLKVLGYDAFVDKEEILRQIIDINTISNKKFIKLVDNNYIIDNIIDITYQDSFNRIKEILNCNFQKLFSVLETVITNDYKKIIICFDNDGSVESDVIINCYLDNLIPSQKIITNIYVDEIDSLINQKIFDKSKNCNIHLLFERNKQLNYFENGEKIYENINGISISKGRIINSTSTINLVRIALKNNNIKQFLEELDQILDLNKNALIQRFEIQANKYKENCNILYNKNLLYDNEKLEAQQKVRKILRNGVLVMGYTGLIETVFILNKNKTNILTIEDYRLLFKIIRFIRKKCESLTNDLKLNFIPAETYDIEIRKKFIQIDKSVFGLQKVINKELYATFYDCINESPLMLEEKIDIFGKYQDICSSIVKIKVKNNINYITYLDLISKMRINKIKYGEFIYDN